MNTESLTQVLDQILPDQFVLKDLSHILQIGEAAIELDEESLHIPLEAPLVVVRKVFLKEYFDDVGFGAYRVQVAIGGIQEQQFGVLVAKYCFATLFYNEKPSLIT